MMKKVFFALCILNCCMAEEKFVIGGFGNEGLFSSFLCVLSDLAWAEKNGKTPVVYWSTDSLYYEEGGFNGSKNVWEYYFEPVSHLTYEPSDATQVWRSMETPDSFHAFTVFCRDQLEFQNEVLFSLHNTLKKYVKIKPSIQAKIDAFYEANMAGKKTVGIHLRGTDRMIKMDKWEMARDLVEAAKKIEDADQYLVATDEQALLDYAKKNIKGKVIHYDCRRSKNATPLHHKKMGGCGGGLIGEEALIETVLLSRCDSFIYTHSAMPIAVLAFNPQINGVYLHPYHWFRP